MNDCEFALSMEQVKLTLFTPNIRQSVFIFILSLYLRWHVSALVIRNNCIILLYKKLIIICIFIVVFTRNILSMKLIHFIICS